MPTLINLLITIGFLFSIAIVASLIAIALTIFGVLP